MKDKKQNRMGWEKRFLDRFTVCDKYWIPRLNKSGDQVSNILWSPEDIIEFIQSLLDRQLGEMEKKLRKWEKRFIGTETDFENFIIDILKT